MFVFSKLHKLFEVKLVATSQTQSNFQNIPICCLFKYDFQFLNVLKKLKVTTFQTVVLFNLFRRKLEFKLLFAKTTDKYSTQDSQILTISVGHWRHIYNSRENIYYKRELKSKWNELFRLRDLRLWNFVFMGISWYLVYLYLIRLNILFYIFYVLSALSKS